MTFPEREERGFRLPGRVIAVSILSLLSSSLGVGREEELEAVMVGDRAGRLGLLASDWGLSRLRVLPRVTWSCASLSSFAGRSTTIGGSRLFSRGGGGGGRSGKLVDEGRGESGRGIVSGSAVSRGGVREIFCKIAIEWGDMGGKYGY